MICRYFKSTAFALVAVMVMSTPLRAAKTVSDKKTPADNSSQSTNFASFSKGNGGQNSAAKNSATKQGAAKKAGKKRTASKKPRLSRRQKLASLLKKKGLYKGDPVFIRIFKREKELELWMRSGKRFTLLKTYPICKGSGHIGPKQRERDYQNPEGFYSIGRSQMKPNSKYHRAFNLGFPNEYDRALGRSGSFLMIHGGCRSVGCFAMTDPLVEEIYNLADAAMRKGQKRFGVHIFPFRMSAVNMDKIGEHRWRNFWWNLKQGHDLFEQTLLPPLVSVSMRRYAFEAAPEPVAIRHETKLARRDKPKKKKIRRLARRKNKKYPRPVKKKAASTVGAVSPFAWKKW